MSPPHQGRIAIYLGLVLTLCWLAVGVSSQTGTPRRITNTPEQALSLNPTLSGDGRHIAFESTESLAGTQTAASFHAFRADLDSAAPTFARLALGRAPAPAVSQDAAHIAFASRDDPLTGNNLDGNSEIFLVQGGQLEQITHTAPTDAARRVAGGNFAPSISDDGRLIAFSSNRNLTGANGDANLELFLYDL
ncbi:MAG TPA: hypothetical protein VF525_03050 [Pyrinomonadaceae bacterium]